jgi:polar amino acid transport system substrate-binding protein
MVIALVTTGRRRAAVVLATSAFSGLVLAGCGSGASDGDPSTSGSAITAKTDPSLAKQVPARLAGSKTMTVGVALGSPPDEFENDQKQIVGWEVDMVRAAAQTLGLKVKLQPNSFDSLIPALQAKRYDAAIGQFGVTSAREQVVDFVTTLQSNELFAARKESDLSIRTLDDLCGHSVATTRASREYEFGMAQSRKCTSAGKKPVDVKVFNDSNQAALSLTSKRTELYWLGGTAINYFVHQTGGTTKVVGSYLQPNPLGIAMPRKSGLAAPMRAAVQQLIENGTYAKILKKWGLESGAIKQAEVNPKVSDA